MLFSVGFVLKYYTDIGENGGKGMNEAITRHQTGNGNRIQHQLQS